MCSNLQKSIVKSLLRISILYLYPSLFYITLSILLTQFSKLAQSIPLSEKTREQPIKCISNFKSFCKSKLTSILLKLMIPFGCLLELKSFSFFQYLSAVSYKTKYLFCQPFNLEGDSLYIYPVILGVSCSITIF